VVAQRCTDRARKVLAALGPVEACLHQRPARGPQRVDIDVQGREPMSRPHHLAITPSILYFGTPVVVRSTLNSDGITNLAPISSAWALDDLFVLGLGANGHTAANLRDLPEVVLNFPWAHQWAQIEQLGLLTGADPVPRDKPVNCRYEADKFAVVGWHPVASERGNEKEKNEHKARVKAVVNAARMGCVAEEVVSWAERVLQAKNNLPLSTLAQLLITVDVRPRV
jgi:hypothetical protein